MMWAPRLEMNSQTSLTMAISSSVAEISPNLSRTFLVFEVLSPTSLKESSKIQVLWKDDQEAKVRGEMGFGMVWGHDTYKAKGLWFKPPGCVSLKGKKKIIKKKRMLAPSSCAGCQKPTHNGYVKPRRDMG